MAILVTGGAGYIGSFVTRRLIGDGHLVVILDDFTTGYRRSMPKEAEVVQGDMCIIKVLHDVFTSYQIDTVIHLGASISVPESFKQPLEYYQNNLVSTMNLLSIGHTYGHVKNFILASSAAVYGNLSLGIDTHDELQPTSPYGWSKLMAEQVVRDHAAKTGICYANLRFFNVGGAWGSKLGPFNRNAANITKRIAQTAAGWNNALDLYGDGNQVRDYVHVEDIADAVIESYRYCRDRGGRFTSNVATGKGRTIMDLVHAVENVTGKAMPINKLPPRQGDVMAMVAGNSTMKNLFGWMPLQSSAEEIMRSQYEWERSKYWEQI
ncbi:UDP-glucose 4-epimerase protein [Rhizobium phage RHph_TM16]|nr:UDP-glucose 4-epimerase protein [Rhizobium phage RHph_TM16]